MKKVPSNVVKRRSRELTNVFEAFTPYSGMEGKVERIWITDIASDGVHLNLQHFSVGRYLLPYHSRGLKGA
ncbi:threonylcarbamoyladenosine tRNA methylthiotransferase-like, partial [Trifolium medium]|nr:threonylcarbamoyladenosine tRNA methylthiotransferase-like [Trifolium medium]